MAQEFLDDAQIGTAIQQMRCERMPEHVRVGNGVDSRGNPGLPDDGLDRPRRQPAAVAIQEQRGLAAFPRERGPACVQIASNRFGRGVAEQHDPFLFTFSAHYRARFIEVDRLEVQRNDLGDADSRGVQKLQNCPVAQTEGVVRDGRRDERRCLFLG